MTPDQISKLPPELRKAAELLKMPPTQLGRADLLAALKHLEQSLTWGLQAVEERDAAKVSRDIWFECAKQQEAKLETAEATIATLTRELSVAMETIHRMGCNTDDCAECAALSHTPEGKS